MPVKTPAAPRTYVLDTSVLLADPAAMSRFAEHEVVIPVVVITELEGKRHHPELGFFARTALRAGAKAVIAAERASSGGKPTWMLYAAGLAAAAALVLFVVYAPSRQPAEVAPATAVALEPQLFVQFRLEAPAATEPTMNARIETNPYAAPQSNVDDVSTSGSTARECARVLKRAGAELEVDSFGMNVIDFPPDAGEGVYPDHDHADVGEEEVYLAWKGSGILTVEGEEIALDQDTMVRVGPETKRKVRSGPDGLRLIVLGGVPGEAYDRRERYRLGAADPAEQQPAAS